MAFFMIATHQLLMSLLQKPKNSPKIRAIAGKMDIFQNRLAGRAYKDMTRSVDQIDKMRRWPFGRRK
ncbi:hypothetical protein BZG06_08240 [Salinivibrio kushneri]|uniref:Uncharacterized protein n=1 Tax=Salinivibrio kushneri TaxID=1908198 RepID=A0AB36K5Q4_9GAMM|nr:hypothetical protein BZG09_08905 [Salinivibrio kushneri]OOE45040.1 hypothetical protein BZG06_08240 [Salinivibrio kushneri]